MSFTMTPSLFNAYLYGVGVGAIITLLLVAIVSVLTKRVHRRWKEKERRRYADHVPGSGSIRFM